MEKILELLTDWGNSEPTLRDKPEFGALMDLITVAVINESMDARWAKEERARHSGDKLVYQPFAGLCEARR